MRGRQLVSDRTPILLDPSGGRARVLAWAGRAVAVVFLVWLVGLVFAGLGLLPSGDLPFGRAFVGQSPPALKTLPPITQRAFAGPSAAGMAAAGNPAARGALTAAAVAAATNAAGTAALSAAGRIHSTGGSGAPANSGRGHGHAPGTGKGGSGSGVSAGGTTAAGTVRASNPNNGLHAAGSGPGRTISRSSPGHTTSSSPPAASSGSGHGNQTTTSVTTTTPGNSGSAPGHTAR